jgi:hypothetical protein
MPSLERYLAANQVKEKYSATFKITLPIQAKTFGGAKET